MSPGSERDAEWNEFAIPPPMAVRDEDVESVLDSILLELQAQREAQVAAIDSVHRILGELMAQTHFLRSPPMPGSLSFWLPFLAVLLCGILYEVSRLTP